MITYKAKAGANQVYTSAKLELDPLMLFMLVQESRELFALVVVIVFSGVDIEVGG